MDGEGTVQHPMRRNMPADRLTIIVDEADQWHHKPLYTEIVSRAHHAGLAGATVLRGWEGFAMLSEIHISHLFAFDEHMPVVVIIVDDHDRVQRFLDSLDTLLDKGVVLRDEVEAIWYRADPR